MAVSLAIALPSSAAADELSRAVSCYQNLDFACAAEAASKASAERPAGQADARRIEALRVLASAHVALGNQTLAKEAFLRLLAEDRSWRPPSGVSPRVRTVFDTALAAAPPPLRPPPPKPLVAPRTRPEALSIASVIAEWVIPVGDEEANLLPAFGVGLRADLPLGNSARLGGLLRLRTHEVGIADLSTREGSPTVDVLEAVATAALERRVGKHSFAAGIEIGAATYGKGQPSGEAVASRSGLLDHFGAVGRLFLAATLAPGGPLAFTLRVAPGTVLTEDLATSASVPFGIGMGIPW